MKNFLRWCAAHLALAALSVAASSCSSDSSRPPTSGNGDGSVTGDVPCDSGTYCTNVCTDLQTNPHHCGTCNTDCAALPHVVGSLVLCVAGRCSLAGACVPGFLHCSSDPSVGCESGAGDPMHCGACDNVCPSSQPSCGLYAGPADAGAGDAAVTVDAPSMDDVAVVSDGPAADAVAADVAVVSDVPVAPDGAVTAANGHFMCASDCGGGQARCGSRCIDLRTDPAHCGSCDAVPCAAGPNAAPACTNGHCGFACATGWGDCDGNAANGCETDLNSTLANCGTCGTVCGSRGNASASCIAGHCGFSCMLHFSDCDGDAANGCEVDLRVSTSHCGGCMTVCAAASHAAAACSPGVAGGGVCGLVCETGFGNCDRSAENGCETDVTSSVTDCGSCHTLCDDHPNAMPTCASSVCGFACNTGFRDCDHMASNGCEANINTSAANCGTCGNACPVVTNGRSACTGGTCMVTCDTGYTFDGTNCTR